MRDDYLGLALDDLTPRAEVKAMIRALATSNDPKVRAKFEEGRAKYARLREQIKAYGDWKAQARANGVEVSDDEGSDDDEKDTATGK